MSAPTGPSGPPGAFGPTALRCPDCDDPVIQFLIGRGTFCKGCGRQVEAIKDGDPWKTYDVRHLPSGQVPHLPPAELTRMAVEDALSGRVGGKSLDEIIREALAETAE